MVDEGFLTEDQLLDALAEQNRSGTPLGKVLVDLGFVSPGAVANALAEQHGGLLRTEYGTSAGLREMAGRAPIRTEAPQPSLPMPAAPRRSRRLRTAPAPLGSGLRLAGPAADAPPEEAPAPVEAPAAVARRLRRSTVSPSRSPSLQPVQVARARAGGEPEPAPEPIPRRSPTPQPPPRPTRGSRSSSRNCTPS